MVPLTITFIHAHCFIACYIIQLWGYSMRLHLLLLPRYTDTLFIKYSSNMSLGCRGLIKCRYCLARATRCSRSRSGRCTARLLDILKFVPGCKYWSRDVFFFFWYVWVENVLITLSGAARMWMDLRITPALLSISGSLWSDLYTD